MSVFNGFKSLYERVKFESWYAPIFASNDIANMPINPINKEYRSAQQQIAWMA